MIDLNTRLRSKPDHITASIIDGEAIIVNLSTGVYYSLDSSGCVVWELVERQQSIGEIVSALSSRFDADGQQVLADVENLVDRLLEEDLVETFFEATDLAQAEPPVSPAPASRPPYVPPALNIYRDMGDLLALDPPMPGLRDIPWKNSV